MTQFLKKLQTQFVRWLVRLVSRTARPTAPHEPIARFIFSSDHVSLRHQRVKPGAFLPEEFKGRLETSVCRTHGISEDRIWHLARTVRQDKQVKATADLLVAQANDAELACEAAPDMARNFPEHAVLTGWPTEKDHQKLIASKLANMATLRFPPDVQASAPPSQSRPPNHN